MFDFKKLGRSFTYAAKGVVLVIREEQNFRLQLLGAAVVTVLMFALKLRTSEKALLTLAMVVVLVLELVNSIFERLVDILKPRIHDYAREIKDIMAGTVLIAAIGTTFIGILIFWPYFVRNL